jgi:hypothetical protein
MNWQKALQAAVAIGAIGVLGLTGLASEDASILQGQRSLAPAGVELSDEELLAVEGEFDPLTIASSMIVWGGIGAGAALVQQLADSQDGVDWGVVAIGFGFGAVGGIARAVDAVAFVRSGLVTTLRWNAVAGAAIQRGFTTAARATGNVVYTAARATSNAFSAAWAWINGRLP